MPADEPADHERRGERQRIPIGRSQVSSEHELLHAAQDRHATTVLASRCDWSWLTGRQGRADVSTAASPPGQSTPSPSARKEDAERAE